MVDIAIQGKTRKRWEFCSFYTESEPILTYMVNRLDIQNGDLILEPCAGNGVFVEKMLATIQDRNVKIDALDLNPTAVRKLKERYHQDRRITIRQTDTLLDTALCPLFTSGGYYSKIIGNPPYGAWQDYTKRDLLKELYGGYVKETYTLFLKKCLDLLKENGRLVFIIPDTFLALHMHKGIRKTLLENSKIEDILLIPSNFFPGVNFGYSNLCVISFVRTRPNINHKIKIVGVEKCASDLYEISRGNYTVANYFEQIAQGEILQSVDHAFLIRGNTRMRKLINETELTLGDVADCVTGFYSGNDTKFIFARDHSVKRSKKYKIAEPVLIEHMFLEQKNLLSGLRGGKKYIPILKGGKSVFTKRTEWFIQWDEKAVEHYRRDRKARFQNSRYYFKEGIGVPMVKSKRINAFMLEKRLFDQSIVAVFPKEKKYLNYLLAFLNSDTCSRILNVINHTANNSANYLKKLPIVYSESISEDVDSIIGDLWSSKEIDIAVRKINRLFKKLYKM